MKQALLFPGQGAQFVGMGADLYREFPAARQVFDAANDVLGFDLRKLCFEGPEDELRQTRNTQPALFVHSMAVLRALEWEPAGPDVRLAGHSLGEYSAYAAAGALSFEDALKVVRRRGELMFEAGTQQPGTMAAVLGLDGAAVESVLANIEGTVVCANFNSPTQIVISGEVGSVEAAGAALTEAGARRVVALEVSGAFHSPLLETAATGLRETLAGVRIEPPRGAVVANESAEVPEGPEAIRASLGRQLLAPVRWEQTLRSMLEWGAERFVEIGPGKVLSGLVKTLERRAVTVPIGTAEQVEAERGARAGEAGGT